MSDFSQGIVITILGMGLVFVSLGALMLIIMGLQYVLRERRPTVALATAAGPQVPFVLDTDPPAPSAVAEPAQEEIVAAIAVAMAVWRGRQSPSRPPQTTVVTFAPGSPAWGALGRLS